MNYEFAEAFFFGGIHQCQQNESCKYSITTLGVYSTFIILGLICNCRFVFCHFQAKKGWLNNYFYSLSPCIENHGSLIVFSPNSCENGSMEVPVLMAWPYAVSSFSSYKCQCNTFMYICYFMFACFLSRYYFIQQFKDTIGENCALKTIKV